MPNSAYNKTFFCNNNLSLSIFGFAIADALGVPFEFKERGSFRCEGMIGHGTHDQPPGTWSDDTSMTLATLKSIKDRNGKIDVDDIRNNFLLWLNKGEFTPDGIVFDIGMSTYEALKSDIPQRDEYSNGNGSLMRILPLAFTKCSDDEIRAVSAITHAHRISMDACVIYVHIVRRLLTGENIHDIIPTLKYEKPFDRLSYIDKLSVSEIRSSGYVVDTLEAALWVVSHKRSGIEGQLAKSSYKEMVLEAVKLGDDTETVAAVTGGLAAIICGLDFAECGEWIDTLRNKELILECLPAAD